MMPGDLKKRFQRGLDHGERVKCEISFVCISLKWICVDVGCVANLRELIPLHRMSVVWVALGMPLGSVRGSAWGCVCELERQPIPSLCVYNIHRWYVV